MEWMDHIHFFVTPGSKFSSIDLDKHVTSRSATYEVTGWITQLVVRKRPEN